MSSVTTTQGLYGTHGWTVNNGVHAIVDAHPCGIFTDESFCRCDNVMPEAIHRLLEVIPPANLDDRQNNAPQCGQLMASCLAGNGNVILSGYVVGPPRTDERITFDGMTIRDSKVHPGIRGYNCEPVGEERLMLWQELAASIGLEGTEHNCPDEMLPTMNDNAPGLTEWWVWWD